MDLYTPDSVGVLKDAGAGLTSNEVRIGLDFITLLK